MKLIKGIAITVAALTLVSAGFAKRQSKDIVDTAMAAGQFKTLASLLTSAGLVDTLKGDGPFTVFAPTDAAFKKLPKSLLEKVGKDKELLKKVLTYHVVAGKVLAADALKLRGKSAQTVAGTEIHLRGKGSVLKINDSKVIKADIICSNGVIHVIDTVLVPPTK